MRLEKKKKKKNLEITIDLILANNHKSRRFNLRNKFFHLEPNLDLQEITIKRNILKLI